MNKKILELKNVSKTYKTKAEEIHVLKNINLTFNSGDFVSLQEVDKFTKRSNFRDVTQDFALELGYNYYYFQKAMDFDKGEFGIAFVSKYDVKNICVHELPSAGNEKRQVLAAQINSSKYKKHILNIINMWLRNIKEKYVKR